MIVVITLKLLHNRNIYKGIKSYLIVLNGRNPMKQKLSVTIDRKTVKLIEEFIKDGLFRNKSHVVEFSLNKILKEKKQNA